jgi:hypothetical protein
MLTAARGSDLMVAWRGDGLRTAAFRTAGLRVAFTALVALVFTERLFMEQLYSTQTSAGAKNIARKMAACDDLSVRMIKTEKLSYISNLPMIITMKI